MIEIIVLFFLGRQISRMASLKGLSPNKWILKLILAWVSAEILGVILGITLFGLGNLVGLMMFALACAFGGYLLVRNRLEAIPDVGNDK
ncbi:MAG: hypothetical protein WD135_02155 [Ferruginibacter sp.]